MGDISRIISSVQEDQELRRWAFERTSEAGWSTTQERLEIAEEYFQWILKGLENE